MKVGNFVEKRGSKGSLGFISEYRDKSDSWKGVWMRGEKQGSTSVTREKDLIMPRSYK